MSDSMSCRRSGLGSKTRMAVDPVGVSQWVNMLNFVHLYILDISTRLTWSRNQVAGLC